MDFVRSKFGTNEPMPVEHFFLTFWMVCCAHTANWPKSEEKSRPVVPACAGCARAHPDFGRSVNPISTKGDRLCPPHYYSPSQILKPSAIPDREYLVL